MVEQLVFDLFRAEPPSFASFVGAGNLEAVELCRRVAHGTLAETSLVLWGARASGRSHLLQATVREAQVAGRRAHHVRSPAELDGIAIVDDAVFAIDDIDTADEPAQRRLFTLYNALSAAGGQLVAACAAPPGRLALRDDLRTRLGWGLVIELVPLADADKPSALVVYARERGIELPPDVIDYLLAHGRRDMGSLVAAIGALDRHSLAVKRPITVSMLRGLLLAKPPR